MTNTAAATLTPTEFASVVTAITSAFGDPTRRDIYLFAHEQPTESPRPTPPPVRSARKRRKTPSRQVGRRRIPRDRTLRARRRGQALQGVLRAEPEIRVEFPVRHHDVLVTLLGKALSLLSAEQAEAMAEEVGIEYGKAMASSLGDADTGRSFRQSLHAVADALTAHGFAAHAQKFGDDLQIVAENCPFGGAAIEHPVICAVDRGMVKGMLGSLYGATSPAIESSLPKGDEVCVTAVDL